VARTLAFRVDGDEKGESSNDENGEGHESVLKGNTQLR